MDKILSYFFQEPEREFHLRELARLVKKSPTTVAKYLKEYEKRSLLISQRKLNHLFYKANVESFTFRHEKKSFNLSRIEDAGVLSYLEKEFNYPRAIVLFGSFAKGDDNLKSDIDICILSPLKKEISLEKFEKKLNKKIHLFVLSEMELQKMKMNNKEFINGLVNGHVLYGSMELFK